MLKFIVISGKKQAGKTTAAKFISVMLEEAYKHKKERELIEEQRQHDEYWLPLGLVGIPTNLVKITSFATPIKEFCSEILGLSEEQIYGTDEQKNSATHIKWDTMPAEIRFRYGRFLAANEICVTSLVPKSGYMTAREVMQIIGTDIFRNFFDYDIWAKAPFNKYKNSRHEYVIIDDCRFPNEADIALKHDALLIRLTRNVLGSDVHISEKAMDGYPSEKYHAIIDNNGYTLEQLQNALLDVLINKKVI